MDANVAVRVSGPVLTGQAPRVIRGFLDEAERQVADEGVRMIRERLDHVLVNPTGYYRSQIASRRDGGDWQVWDSNVIYGPWLEGTGSRNRTTRFKGYATFRRTTGLLQRRSNDIAGRVLRTRFIGRLG